MSLEIKTASVQSRTICKQKTRAFAAGLLLLPIVALNSSAVDVTVNSLCNIFGAGHPIAPNNAPTVGTHGGGVPPAGLALSALSNAPVLFFEARGAISYCVGCGSNGPDGTNFISAGPSYNGISGITNIPGRCLVGVFTGATEPADPSPPPLDFAIIGTNYLSLAPAINQQFFIGDGLAAPSGALQAVFVPRGASTLHLGFVDGFSYAETPDGYNDNTGSLTVTITPALYLRITNSAGTPGVSVYGPIGTTNRVDYTDALPTANWLPLTNVVLSNLPAFLLDAAASGKPRRFYRAVQAP